MATSSSPVSETRMKQICNDACDSALATSASYDHAHTAAWNNAIINSILKALISESTPSAAAASSSSSDEAASAAGKYKFAVNSTIIQHLSDPRSGSEEGAESKKPVGRRGMHSASGAYWNNEKDGMWSHKYEGGESKGMDIVISVMWIAL